MSNLVGTEVLEVTGLAQNGQRSAQTVQVTTQQIANLAAGNYSAASNTGTNYVSSTTLTNPTGLTGVPLLPGTYHVTGQIPGSAPALCGIAAELTGTAGLVVSGVNITGWNYNGTTINAVANTTVLASDFANSANAFTNIEFDGSLIVTTGGTLNLQTAQHSSSTATTSVALGTYLSCVLL